jgi:senataxin
VPSNAAVDELLSRLNDRGVFSVSDGVDQQRATVRLVRLGEAPEGAPETIRAMTLEAQTQWRLERDEVWAHLTGVRRTLAAVERCIASVRAGDIDALIVAEVHALLQNRALSEHPANALLMVQQGSKGHHITTAARLLALQSELAMQRQLRTMYEIKVDRQRVVHRNDVLATAHVVAGTLSAAGSSHMLDHTLNTNIASGSSSNLCAFDTVIIDEAGQCTEPAALIPLRYGCRNLVLVGDPRQLPPTVLSANATAAGLGMSLFERLERAEHSVTMLTVQYRMHPGIVFILP